MRQNDETDLDKCQNDAYHNNQKTHSIKRVGLEQLIHSLLDLTALFLKVVASK